MLYVLLVFWFKIPALNYKIVLNYQETFTYILRQVLNDQEAFTYILRQVLNYQETFTYLINKGSYMSFSINLYQMSLERVNKQVS